MNKQCRCRANNEYCSDLCSCSECDNRPPNSDDFNDQNDTGSQLDDATKDEENNGEDESDEEDCDSGCEDFDSD